MPGKYWRPIIDAAVDNGGYVTPSMVDVPAVELRKMVARGTLDSAAHGVYRVPELPRDRYDEFILARLWATGRGVISHDSALLVHELCDINPTAIHITIPTTYRINRAGGEQYELHKRDLADADITRLDAVVLTTIRRTLDDCVDLVPEYLLRQAIDTAAGRGAINSNDRERLVDAIGTTTVS
jgi:predicted transcriptional regulator of viral defense system